MITVEDMRRMLGDEIDFHETRITELQRDGGHDEWGLMRHQQRPEELRQLEGGI